TGVQTCALPISSAASGLVRGRRLGPPPTDRNRSGRADMGGKLAERLEPELDRAEALRGLVLLGGDEGHRQRDPCPLPESLEPGGGIGVLWPVLTPEEC